MSWTAISVVCCSMSFLRYSSSTSLYLEDLSSPLVSLASETFSCFRPERTPRFVARARSRSARPRFFSSTACCENSLARSSTLISSRAFFRELILARSSRRRILPCTRCFSRSRSDVVACACVCAMDRLSASRVAAASRSSAPETRSESLRARVSVAAERAKPSAPRARARLNLSLADRASAAAARAASRLAFAVFNWSSRSALASVSACLRAASWAFKVRASASQRRSDAWASVRLAS
mmetsp:Transcript_6505/g.20931  ORF Transcript_6505/g.20931 Transcript_6505/m.20931 type:complete len:239 (-) Transcript_6505:377-1093(-)